MPAPLNVVVFSKDRAPQLELLLRSAERFVDGWSSANVAVLYTCDSDAHLAAYEQARFLHPSPRYVFERDRDVPFKELVLEAVRPEAPLTMFLVDDDVFKEPFSLDVPQLALLERDPELVCVSLRMAPGMDYCYPSNRHVAPPRLDDRLVWRWPGAEGDWGYPMSLDGHIFRTRQLLPLLEAASFFNPNSLEASLAASPIPAPLAACLPQAPVVNVPANRVQDTAPNRHGGGSADTLLDEFRGGRLLALEPLVGLATPSPHHDVPLVFNGFAPQAAPAPAPRPRDPAEAFVADFEQFAQLSARSAERFRLDWSERHPCLDDATAETGFDRHYVYFPAWAARVVRELNPERHVDISSTLHFCSILSAFLPVDFYDYRPADLHLDGLESRAADLLALPFAAGSVPSLSCLHVIEHIGLGRYGDPLDPEGDLKACAELERVLAPGGDLLVAVPVGEPRIMFNAHRIYGYEQLVAAFPELELVEFALIPGDARDGGLIRNADPALVARESYGCGCFRFRRPEHGKPKARAAAALQEHAVADAGSLTDPEPPNVEADGGELSLLGGARETTGRAAPAQPRVSVVIPCHNHGRFLLESAGSVLEQTLQDFELVIVDDGSTDETATVAAELAASDARVHVVQRPASGHPSIARNTGIAASSGEFVLCLDADDRIDVDFLRACVGALDAQPDASIAYGAQQNFGLDTTFHPCGPYDFRLQTTQNIFGCCSLFRRSAWLDAGGYDPGVGYEDWDFWIACGERGHGAVWVPSARWYYRVSDSGMWSKDRADDQRIKARIVLNHPRLYSPTQLLWAAGVLSGDPEALAIDAGTAVIPRFADCDEPPSRLEGERDAVVLASAAELVANPSLPAAWGRLFGDSERMTLLLEDAVGPDETVRPEVAALVRHLGLEQAAADVVALPRVTGVAAATLAQMADAVLSERQAADDIFRGLPRYSGDSLPELAAHLAGGRGEHIVRLPRSAQASESSCDAQHAACEGRPFVGAVTTGVLPRAADNGSMSLAAALAPFALASGADGRIWPPPDSLKRMHLLSLFQSRGHGILIEAGTYLGDTVEHFLPHAEGIISIELEPTLHSRAAARFAECPHVTILRGDATDLIPPIFDLLDTPPLVFLDGHFSGGETGCGDEVEPAQTILELLGRAAIAGTTIVVDDLRLFGADPGFPTLDSLLTTARSTFPSAQICAGVDSLVIAL